MKGKIAAITAWLVIFAVSAIAGDFLTYTTKPDTITASDYLTTALIDEVDGMFDETYANFSKLDAELYNAQDGYASIAARLSAMDTAIASAGDGDAYFKVGTDAERLADSALLDMVFWATTDTNIIWYYEAGGAVWQRIVTTDMPVGSAPTVSASAIGVYAKDDTASDAALFVREESNGTEIQMTRSGNVAAAPPLTLPIQHWQTLASEYTVEAQDASNANGHGVDLIYHYVFKDAQTSAMYAAIAVPFSGYDLRLVVNYRMSSSASGDVVWGLGYIVLSAADTQAELASLATWEAADTAVAYTDTPSATANVLNEINTASFDIPYTAYTAGDVLYIMLKRVGADASDTRTGNAEVIDSIYLKPVVP